MWEEEVPSDGWEGHVNASVDGNEMGFECSDRSFGNIAAVHVRWDQLVCAVPLVHDASSVVSTGFIDENNCVHRKILSRWPSTVRGVASHVGVWHSRFG